MSVVRWSARLGLTLGAAFVAACQQAPEPHRGQNVVFITVDTLRADHVGTYGYESAHTPHIDALAESGVVFEQAISPVPVTLPAHASLFTGLFPPTHGVRDNTYFRLDDDASTLAELLKAEGYQTAAFVGAFVLDHSFGLDQGFDVYDDDMDGVKTNDTDAPGSFAERRGETVRRAFSVWLDGALSDEPFFAWLHFFDPHLPYRGSYDDEIAYADEQIGAVIAKLSEHELLDDTLIVLTSDHGESLGEHGEKSHGFFVYDQTLHVPLILASRRSLPAGRRIASQVRTVDVLPTVLATLALPIPESLQGRNLLPQLDEQTDAAAYAECYVSQLNFGWAPLVALRRDGYKYIDAPKPELYDLTNDPAETRNLYDDERERAREMRAELSDLLSGWPESISSRVQPDPETIARLRALGYTGSGGGDTERRLEDVRELADPKDRLHLWSKLEELILLQSEGETDAVAAGARAVLNEDGTNLLALELLASALSKSDRLDEALQVYERIVELDDTRPLSHLLHGNLLWRAGRIDEAERSFLTALSTDASFARAYRRLGELYVSTGRGEKARASFEAALELDDTVESRLGLARSLTLTGDANGAASELERLAREYPDDVTILTEYAGTLARRGDVHKAIRLLRQGPDHEDVHYTLSVLYRSTGQMEDSLAELEKAVALRPDFAAAQNDLGVLLSRSGRLEEAVTTLRKALALEETPATHNSLGTALCRLERCEEGVRHFEKAVEESPELVEALDNLAQAYYLLGRERDAERIARRAEQVKSRR